MLLEESCVFYFVRAKVSKKGCKAISNIVVQFIGRFNVSLVLLPLLYDDGHGDGEFGWI